MRVEFQCTYDDYREANQGHLAGAKGTGAKPRRLLAGLVGWLVFVALAAVLVFLTRSSKGPSVTAPILPVILPAGRALIVRFLNASISALMFCVIYGCVLARAVLMRPRPAWLPPARGPRWMGLVVFIPIAAAVFSVISALNPETKSDSGTRPSEYEILLSALPCLLFLLVMFVFVVTHRGFELERRWKAQPFLQRAHSLEASDAGITLEEPRSMHRYQWDYFPGFRETLNTLLLYVSPYGFWVIPKRAFATTEELEAFKALLLTHVQTGTLLPASSSGFPVGLLPPALPTARLAFDTPNPPGS